MHAAAAVLGPSALVVREFHIDITGQSGTYVRIVGRKAGVIAWLLARCGVDTTTVFEVHKDHILFTQSNLSGTVTTVTPLTSISTTSSGFFKPILYLVLGIPLLAAFGLGLIFIIYYFLHKSLMVTVEAHSGGVAAIAFKSSVIEGVKVDKESAEQVAEIINKLVMVQNER